MKNNLSPRFWTWYWWGGIALGAVILIVGAATGDALMIFLGVALVVAGVGLIAFWRRIGTNA